MDKFNANSVEERAFLYDSEGNEYTGEALYMALLLKATAGGERNEKSERELAKMLDDQNLKD